MGRNRNRWATAACALAAVAVAAGAAASAPADSSGAGSPAGAAAGVQAKGEQDAPGARRRAKLRKQRLANARQKRPNVVVIETDDQSDSLTGMSSVQALLAARGTTFANSYAAYPLCCPSRATFLTGQYSHNNNVISTDLIKGYGALDQANTLPVWLRRAGYRTAMVGKYLNGYGVDDGFAEAVPDAKQVPPGWTDWFSLTGGQDQRRYNYKLNENGRIRVYGAGPADYVTDVLASKAIGVIKRRAPSPNPFFLWFTPTAPHGESPFVPGAARDPTPAPRHLGRYEEAAVPRTPSFNEADVSDKPGYIAATDPLTSAEIDTLDVRYRSQLESLLAVDEAVKRIVGRVRKAGDARRTYFVFTSDNGLQMGSHRLLFKAHLYEESTRVPLIVRGPGFPAGVVRRQLVSNVDLAPTITALTGAVPTLALDGRALGPIAQSATALAGRDLLLESYQTGAAAVRSGHWAYIEHLSGDRELYDLAADPLQLDNSYGEAGYEAITATLAARLADIRDCRGGACP